MASGGAGTIMHVWTLDKKALDTAVPGSLILCLADNGICLRMGSQEIRVNSPLQGQSGLIPSVWLEVSRMTALLNHSSRFIGSLPIPSGLLNSPVANAAMSLGCPSDVDLVSLGIGFSV